MTDFTQNVSELIKALRVARHRNEIVEILTKCKTFALNSNDSLRPGSFYPLGEAILDCCSPGIFGLLTKKEQNVLFMDIFASASPVDVLLLIHKFITDDRGVFQTEKVIQLSAICSKNLFKRLFEEMCYKSTADTADSLFDSLCQAIVALPNNVANVLKGAVPVQLKIDNYCRDISLAFICAVNRCYDLLKINEDCSLKFHSQLIGKLQLVGYSKNVLKLLIPYLNGKCKNCPDFIWTRIAQRLLLGAPRNSVEQILTEIVQMRKFPVSLRELFGDTFLADEKARFVLTKKLLFVRYFEDDEILWKIFDCFTSVISRPFLVKVIVDLLHVWGSEFSTTTTPFQQHVYQTKAIVIATALLTKSEKIELNCEITNLLLPGVQTHLQSPRDEVRLVGMVLAEILTQTFEIGKTSAALKFEYSENEMTLLLKKLAKGKFVENDSQDDVNSLHFLEFQDESSVLDDAAEFDNFSNENIVIDSDDDLEPYEMPEETISQDPQVLKIKTPVYLNDCLDMLHDNKDVHHFELAFRKIEQLVREDGPGLSDLASTLLNTILHLEDRYSTENFDEIRVKTMIACCVQRPSVSADFLTKEMYAKNLCLQHRMDILDVLLASAKELSNTRNIKSSVNNKEVAKNLDIGLVVSPPWQELVQQRINAKTKLLTSKGLRKSENNKVAVPNRFLPFAGQFFYALLANFDRCEDSTLDLINRDYFVLVRLLYTTGSILICAENGPDCVGMSACMIDFIWSLKEHKEPLVRQGVLFCLFCAITTVPERVLAVLFQDSLSEVRFWLDNQFAKDIDSQCKELSIKVLQVLHQRMNSGLNSFVEVGLNR